MTDRELLELAAKAAGYGLPGIGDHDEIGRQYEYELGLWVKYGINWWDWFRPHLDDGDALRLAVRLRIDVIHDDSRDNDAWVMAGNLECVEDVDGEGTRASATRRAIVRAAAEIGRALP